MKGIIVDCKTGKITEIDDGLPRPESPSYVEPTGVDLADLARKLSEIDELKARIENLEKKYA
jgi:hypothetical protein